jgi:Delta-aminolevulinic acid dehydratase
MFPQTRMRRLRNDDRILTLARETTLSADQLILPAFFRDEKGSKDSTKMPGVKIHSVDNAEETARSVSADGVKSMLLFGTPSKKDSEGTGAYDENGVVQKTIRNLKDSEMYLIADVCLCEYTNHGQCGILCGDSVDNDRTLELYGKTAVSLADAGADMIAPSGMMDGQIAFIRKVLDDSGHRNIPIMAYSAKFNSSFYGPFREAADIKIAKGDRSGYQIQCGNRREAMREMELDISEGADMIMIKPAMPYLDIIREARERFDVPIAAYQVSGEYSMIKAAASLDMIDEKKAMMESLISIKRAGADMIITYFASDAAKILEGRD